MLHLCTDLFRAYLEKNTFKISFFYLSSWAAYQMESSRTRSLVPKSPDVLIIIPCLVSLKIFSPVLIEILHTHSIHDFFSWSANVETPTKISRAGSKDRNIILFFGETVQSGNSRVGRKKNRRRVERRNGRVDLLFPKSRIEFFSPFGRPGEEAGCCAVWIAAAAASSLVFLLELFPFLPSSF